MNSAATVLGTGKRAQLKITLDPPCGLDIFSGHYRGLLRFIASVTMAATTPAIAAMTEAAPSTESLTPESVFGLVCCGKRALPPEGHVPLPPSFPCVGIQAIHV